MHRFLSLALCLSLFGCGDDDGGTDAGVDSGVDSGLDAGVDAGEDAGDDAGSDAGDAGEDTGTDAAEDATMDAPVDAVADVGAAFDAMPMDCIASTLRFEGGALPQMTLGETNDYDPSGGCVGAITTGPDRIYALVPSLGGGTYRIVATPVTDDWNPMIYVLTDCVGETCTAGSNLGGINEVETLDVTVAEGEIVYVVVDTSFTPAGTNLDGGVFMLTAEKLR